MGLSDRRYQLFLRKILRIGSCAEFPAAQIYRIRSGIYRRKKAFITAAGCKQFHSFFHRFSRYLKKLSHSDSLFGTF